ncbi:DUF4150 domain-containing protein [Azohydromonas caseinilytica]|uniref:DUF4150 domain-containing protein n=1 Tax=Azohydromonas caseinilytica TaxID=2728836 RepID=A0A848FB27_9BURK|nr:DUF4150 domain-containing protein [Azohydromonas caseinilytica]NML16532.1 DUF4150 domain-containing protein [Azohydromonas caseinilytica]
MSDQVFANGMEISCKAASQGKSICAFPDVCFTPPQTPATPTGVPVPYPNTGMASDCTDGSTSVQISGQEVMLKDKSYFKKSTGDEAGSAPKKGLITGTIQGKVYFVSWSMDVLVEQENVVRHLDSTTHNHACPNANEQILWPHIVSQATAGMQTKPLDKCPAECKTKKTHKTRYKNLRKGTPSDKAQASVNRRRPKICDACKQPAATLAADHVVPLKKICEMPGFACLPNEKQEEIADAAYNYDGLCGSCNSSKCDRLWHNWKRVKVRNLTLHPSTRAAKIKKTEEVAKRITKEIRETPCKE